MIISFGKYKNKTLKEVWNDNPGYFSWIKNGYYYKNIKPKWILNTKYSNKALENNKVVNWFFFKKK